MMYESFVTNKNKRKFLDSAADEADEVADIAKEDSVVDMSPEESSQVLTISTFMKSNEKGSSEPHMDSNNHNSSVGGYADACRYFNQLLAHALTRPLILASSFTSYNPSPTQTNNDFIDHLAINRSSTSYKSSYEDTDIGNVFTSPVVVMAPVGDDHSNISRLFSVAPMGAGMYGETAAYDDHVAGGTSLLTHGDHAAATNEAISDAVPEDVDKDHHAADTFDTSGIVAADVTIPLKSYDFQFNIPPSPVKRIIALSQASDVTYNDTYIPYHSQFNVLDSQFPSGTHESFEPGNGDLIHGKFSQSLPDVLIDLLTR